MENTLRIFKIIDQNYEEFWLTEEEITTVYTEFGRLIEATQYDLTNPLNITDQVNGDYFDE